MDKYEKYRLTILEAYRPDPNYQVSEWADRYRMLSNKASAEPGKWRTSRTPYLKEIMDRLSSTDRCEQVVFMKGSQVGGALSLDTRLPTPSGWTTMGEVKVGSILLDEKERPTYVTFKSDVFENNVCYEITLCDGSKIISDHIHRWVVNFHSNRCIFYTPVLHTLFNKGETLRIWEKYPRKIISINVINSVKTACISVDSPNRMYMCHENFVPTHNTEAGNNWIGYVMDHAPAPMLFVQPTLEMAKRNTKQRLDPLIEESPRLQDKVVKAKSRASGNTMFQKEFQGGILIITGANSPSGLRSMPARYIFFDECDAYPGDCDGEGSPISLAKARARTFNKRKFFLVSTPTISGMSPIENAFEDSNKYWFHVPCPHCGFEQKLIFTQLKYEDKDPGTTRYECAECHEPIYNWQKTSMLKAGRWVCEDYDPKNKSAGYHLSSLYSPVGWYSWNEIIADWFEAQKSPEALRTFVNTVLGETWKEKTDVPQWNYLYERRSSYKRNRIPKRVVFLTAGCDVQKDRIEIEIVGWCPQKISYSIDYRVIVGQTDDLSDDCWAQLDRMLVETWTMERQTGRKMAIKKLAIDSGFNTQVVYSWVRRQDPSRVIAIKGQENQNMILGTPKMVDINAKGKTVKRGVRLWPVGVGVAKTELYGWLRQAQGTEEGKEPYGFCHFPEYDAEFFKMLTAEEYVTKIVKGYKRGEWTKTRERNEALDCRVYARAAACAEGMDRFTDETWAKLSEDVYNPQIKNASKRPQRKKEKREGWL